MALVGIDVAFAFEVFHAAQGDELLGVAYRDIVVVLAVQDK
jgi:hypothetical protein